MSLIRFPNFTGGSFTAQNPLASRERTMNFCPDVLKTPGAANQLVLDPTPGVALRSTATGAPNRALYEHNGRVYLVSGRVFYELLNNWTAVAKGTVVMDEYPATIVSNGLYGGVNHSGELFITSGDHGYIYDTSSDAFVEVLPSGAAMGGMLDGFFITLNRNDSSWRVSKLLEGTDWNEAGSTPVYRSAAPDPWRAFEVTDKLIALFGDKTTEFWYNAGLSPFPFAYVPNALIPFGIHAPFSKQVVGDRLCWLARTADDANEVVMVHGTTPTVISTPALRWALKTMPRTDDALGFSDSYLGHICYGLTFPTAGETWVFDLSTGLWHEEGVWIAEENRYDALRQLHRCYAFGQVLVGDRLTGKIYEKSVEFAFHVDGRPLRRVRRAPLLFGNGRMMSFGSFELVCQVGVAGRKVLDPETRKTKALPRRRKVSTSFGVTLGGEIDPSTDPQVELRRSNDGGETWWSAGFRSTGEQGDFSWRPTWNRLGATDQMAGFEVVMTSPVPARIVDALVDIQ